MTFDQPDALLWLLLIVPLTALSLWAAGRAAARRRRFLGRLAFDLAPSFSRLRRMLRDGLVTLAVALSVVALAGPEVGT